MDALGLARRYGSGKDRDAVMRFSTRLLLGVEPVPAWRERLNAVLGREAVDEAEAARRVTALILALPEAQLA